MDRYTRAAFCAEGLSRLCSGITFFLGTVERCTAGEYRLEVLIEPEDLDELRVKLHDATATAQTLLAFATALEQKAKVRASPYQR